MRSIVLASDNPGKLAEFNALLAALGIEATPQGALGIPQAREPHLTFVENALAKARHASRQSGRPALADDSGLCARALAGAPGVHSARYAQRAGGPKSDAANNARLVRELRGCADRGAHYVCVLVYVRHAEDPRPILAEGDWFGQITEVARGDGGFGYDPHFLLPELGQTAAELSRDEKNRISHRARALTQLVARLRALEPDECRR